MSSKRLNPQRFNVRIATPSLRSFPLHTEVSGSAPESAFGSFRVLHQIGAGVLGPVFRACDSGRDRMVAVKLFRLDLPPDRVHRLVADFEKLIAAELTHPGIAAPIETGIAGTNAFLVQDYVAADSLDTTVRAHGAAPVGDALRVAARLAGALDFAAVVDIAHGALHPRDVLLSPDEVRLTGIGVARALEHVGGVVLMRRPYAPPERIAGSSWDRRADIFSLAAVMYELLWGRRLAATGAQAAEGLTELPHADMGRLRAVFARAVAEDPAGRFETALEFAAALKDAFPGVALGNSPQSSVVSRQSEAAGDQSEVVSRQSGVRGRKSKVRLKTGDLGLKTDDLGLTANESPRLPLDQPEETAADLDLRASEIPAPEAERFADVQTAPAVVQPPLVRAAINPVASASFSAYEQSRSAVWPLVMAVGVGVALGFAAGYGVGIRERSMPAAVAQAGVPPAGQEFTERVVTEPPVKTVGTSASAASSQSGVAPPAAAPRVSERGTPPTPAAAARAARVAPPKERTRPATVLPVTGALSVESKPPGASVFVNNRLVGKTPVSLSEIAAGDHTIRLELSGYRRWSSPVRIVPKERNRVTASLER